MNQTINEKNHLQVRLDKAFDEINTVQNENERLTNICFIDYLFRCNKKALNP